MHQIKSLRLGLQQHQVPFKNSDFEKIKRLENGKHNNITDQSPNYQHKSWEGLRESKGLAFSQELGSKVNVPTGHGTCTARQKK